MLSDHPVHATLPTADLAGLRRFYEDVLGFTAKMETPAGIFYGAADGTQGIGTGSLREHVDALVAGGITIHASGMSSKARGLTADSLGGPAVTMAPPAKLIELTLGADRVLTY